MLQFIAFIMLVLWFFCARSYFRKNASACYPSLGDFMDATFIGLLYMLGIAAMSAIAIGMFIVMIGGL